MLNTWFSIRYSMIQWQPYQTMRPSIGHKCIEKIVNRNLWILKIKVNKKQLFYAKLRKFIFASSGDYDVSLTVLVFYIIIAWWSKNKIAKNKNVGYTDKILVLLWRLAQIVFTGLKIELLRSSEYGKDGVSYTAAGKDKISFKYSVNFQCIICPLLSDIWE